MRAFYLKCRPLYADLIGLVRTHRRVFVGYAPWTCTPPPQHPRTWRDCILDISVSDDEWLRCLQQLHGSVNSRTYRSRVTANRDFARKVKKGDLVVVPRPGSGMCHIGRISGPFELVDAPSWGSEYIQLRKAGDLECTDEVSHVSDVVQTWPVDGFVSIAFPLIPRWISYLLLSRNTIGWLTDSPDGRSAAALLNQVYEGSYCPDISPTCDLQEIAMRLTDWVSPSMFEHLVCELLQLENPGVRWVHVGGAGDGGADGIAIDAQRRVIGMLQCKWKYDGSIENLVSDLSRQLIGTPKNDCGIRIYVAVLFDRDFENVVSTDGVRLLTRQEIAALLLKHNERCGMALTLAVRPSR